MIKSQEQCTDECTVECSCREVVGLDSRILGRHNSPGGESHQAELLHVDKTCSGKISTMMTMTHVHRPEVINYA